MKLVVLGANGYRPSDLGHTACYAIPELGIILDAGTGMWRMADYLQTTGLDIYLSHPHPDHTWGLVYLEFIFWRQMARQAAVDDDKVELGPTYGSLLSSPPLARVHVAEEHRPNIESQVKRFRDHRLVEFVSVQTTEPIPRDGTLTSFAVPSRGDQRCYGFRLDWPESSLAYVTDIYAQPGASYVNNIRGVDLLLHVCYLPDGETDLAKHIGPSHTTPVAQLAAEAAVGRLLLVHLNPLRPHAGEPDLDRARQIFPATGIACDEMEIDF